MLEIREGGFMIDNQNNNSIPVDRHEETVITQQPGFAVTEQVSYDAAAERRMSMFQITRIFYTLLSLLEVLLGMRFFLKLIAANPESGFAWFIYGISGLFVMPFTDLVSNWATGGSLLEVTTLIAMVVYVLVFWGMARVFRILADHPIARSVMRTTHQQNNSTGTNRTTRTVRRD